MTEEKSIVLYRSLAKLLPQQLSSDRKINSYCIFADKSLRSIECEVTDHDPDMGWIDGFTMTWNLNKIPQSGKIQIFLDSMQYIEH